MMRANSLLARCAVLCAAALCAAVVLSLGVPGRAHAQEPHAYWLIVSGLSGEPEYAQEYDAWSAAIADAATKRYGATKVWRLAENTDHGAAAVSSKASITSALSDIARTATTSDAVFVILIGHGSAPEGGEARLSLPGPDITPTDLALMLDPVQAHVTVVNTTSTSGAWLKPLAKTGRVVVTSTKSGGEQNEPIFGEYFTKALTGGDADTDKDGAVSVLEAFDYARAEVARAYAADKKLLTEHAQIDGNGDGAAVASAAVDSPDGAVASVTHFGAAGVGANATQAGQPSAALKALYAEKQQLEQQLATLRTHKAEYAEADYQKALDALLLKIAQNGAAIRAGGGQ